jgi:hypothetical protein
MADPRVINEERRFRSCRAAFEKLAADDGRLTRLALSNIRRWEEHRICNAGYVLRWREILGMPVRYARELVLANTDEAAALRQNHPFAGFFTESERQTLRQVRFE